MKFATDNVRIQATKELAALRQLLQTCATCDTASRKYAGKLLPLARSLADDLLITGAYIGWDDTQAVLNGRASAVRVGQ